MTPPGRNDPCPCGSGRKYKACCARTEPRPVDVVYAPQIDPSLRDLERRQAEFWRPLEGGRVACDLCYRLCEIEDGAAGWCKIRRNDGGRLVIPEHGTISGVQKQHNGYNSSAFVLWKPGLRGVFAGGISCTSGCSFCMSRQIALQPAKVPWVGGETYGSDRLLPSNSWWYGRRGKFTPSQLVDSCLRSGASYLELGLNEPTLTAEFTLDVARLAKRKGVSVILDSNGFSTPEVIKALAPFVDAVLFGIKGSADPEFYARHMRSPGAVPHVLESLRTWYEFPHVHTLASDLVAAPHLQSEDAADEAQQRLYAWIAEQAGELAPVIIGPMTVPIDLELGTTPGIDPGEGKGLPYNGWLLARGGNEEQAEEYRSRLFMAMQNARFAGLRYAHAKSDDCVIPCHNCGAALLRFRSPMLHCEPCSMAKEFCPYWSHEEHVTPDGRCQACGAQTPLVGMTEAEKKREAAWRKIAYRGGSVRTRVSE